LTYCSPLKTRSKRGSLSANSNLGIKSESSEKGRAVMSNSTGEVRVGLSKDKSQSRETITRRPMSTKEGNRTDITVSWVLKDRI
jgi:hypothetical protein